MSDQEVEKWSGRAKPGMPFFVGPADVRDEFIREKGIDWTASYIDPAEWFPQTRTIQAWTTTARKEIKFQTAKLCAELRITVSDLVGFRP